METKQAPGPTHGGGSRGAVSLSFHQFRFDLIAFLRNGQSRFFTLALPVLFLIIFGSVFGGAGHTVKVSGGTIPTSAYYVPGIITLGIIAAAFINLVISVTTQRETGVLKRRRATPVPAAAIIGGRSFTAVVVALFTTTVLVILGWIFFKAHVQARTFPALVVTVIVGTISFCCLGYALASFIRNEDAAQPVTQALVLPLYFISGVFVAVTVLPHWLVDIADIFPVRHLVAALQTVYNPHLSGAGFAISDLLVVVAWGAAGLIVALKRFTWLPVGH
jgi:ABC-2 type transport system permease protein